LCASSDALVRSRWLARSGSDLEWAPASRLMASDRRSALCRPYVHLTSQVRTRRDRRAISSLPIVQERSEEIAVSDRAALGGLTQFPRLVSLTRFEPTESKRDRERRTRGTRRVRQSLRDLSQLVDSKPERCRSGRSSTLGKRFWPTTPSDIKTPHGAFDSATCGDNMLRDVTP
jgi:hypothetical protein